MSFHCFAELPKSYVLSAFGIKLEVKSAGFKLWRVGDGALLN